MFISKTFLSAHQYLCVFKYLSYYANTLMSKTRTIDIFKKMSYSYHWNAV